MAFVFPGKMIWSEIQEEKVTCKCRTPPSSLKRTAATAVAVFVGTFTLLLLTASRNTLPVVHLSVIYFSLVLSAIFAVILAIKLRVGFHNYDCTCPRTTSPVSASIANGYKVITFLQMAAIVLLVVLIDYHFNYPLCFFNDWVTTDGVALDRFLIAIALVDACWVCASLFLTAPTGV